MLVTIWIYGRLLTRRDDFLHGVADLEVGGSGVLLAASLRFRSLTLFLASLLRLRYEGTLRRTVLLCEQSGRPFQMHGFKALDILADHDAGVPRRFLILVRVSLRSFARCRVHLV